MIAKPSKAQFAAVDKLVRHYVANRDKVELALQQIRNAI